MVRVMIPAFLPRLGVAALLCCFASLAIAQQEPAKQRSRTVTEPKKAKPKPEPSKPEPSRPAQTRNAPAAPQKAGAGTAKPAPAGQAKPAAAGQAKPGSSAPSPGGGKATLLASFGDWGAYATGQGRARICYALSQPKERLPKDLKRDPGYLFVSFRPGDNVRNEIALRMGFTTRDGGEAEATIGKASYALLTKGTDAWVRNQAEENQVVAAMTKGQSLVVKATSLRGNASTDRYSLTGFADALDRARKECS
jgi:hypothetical protein